MTDLAVTEAVLRRLAEAIPAAGGNGSGGHCYRFEIGEDNSPQLQVCEPAATDMIYRYQGRNVLAIPPEFAEAYAGSTLDINEAGDFLLL